MIPAKTYDARDVSDASCTLRYKREMIFVQIMPSEPSITKHRSWRAWLLRRLRIRTILYVPTFPSRRNTNNQVSFNLTDDNDVADNDNGREHAFLEVLLTQKWIKSGTLLIWLASTEKGKDKAPRLLQRSNITDFTLALPWLYYCQPACSYVGQSYLISSWPTPNVSSIFLRQLDYSEVSKYIPSSTGLFPW